MATLIIEGGQRLSGDVTASGSKNGALALMAATLLVEGEVVLHNLPRIGDVQIMVEMLQALGARAELSSDGVLSVNASQITDSEAPASLVKRMRASFSVLGPLLARTGLARVAMPGGCNIGSRPIDFHIKGIQSLGASVRNDHGIVEARAERLTGARIYMAFPSAGATQQIMTAACLADGVTTIENAACEPEIADLALFLNRCGAKVQGAGTNTVQVEGVERLTGVEHTIIPDRVEIGTFALAAVNTNGEVFIRKAVPEHLTALTQKLQEIGAMTQALDDGLFVACKRTCVGTDIVTMPHPGFATDLQQPMGAVLATADGTSIITEKVYENRFRYLDELKRMGADAHTENRTAIIRGVPRLHGAAVTACDLRAGAALTIAALGAEGITEISDVEHIHRGYENLDGKLNALGARVLSGDASTMSEVLACLE
ncbi:MAG: UDP-N-acetylglucosamine 1-carboxyvinyltransferase [Armatimonadetes bacterium]|nr:UDP-N-acetylglucosamine 1-carboxyvinyltransferase [Armatimonadota bacterium]